MKKILKKISGLVIILLAIFAWSIYSSERAGERNSYIKFYFESEQK